MTSLVLLAVDALVLFATFRGLSSPAAGLGPAVRTALGTLVLFFVAVASLWVRCDRWTVLSLAVAAAVATSGLRGEGLARHGEALGRYRFAVYILSVATLSALIYVFVPITTLLTSPGELGIHLDYLLTVNLRDAMVVVYVAAALFVLLPSERMKTALALLAAGTLAVAMVFGYALPFGYPRMSGLTFEQVGISSSQRGLRLLADVAVVVAVGLALRAAAVRVAPRRLLAGLLLADLSLVGSALWAVSRPQTGGAGDVEAASIEQPLRFSPSRPNVLIVFLDRFMGGYVEPILAQDPGLAERLTGFTWYPRTVSAGENSIAGLHPLLGGYDYTPEAMNARHAPLRDLSVEAFSILPYNFSRKGYAVSVVNPDGLGFTMSGDCSYLAMKGVTCTHISKAVVTERAAKLGFPLREISSSSYSDLLVLLAGMRTAPYLLKEAIHLRGPWRPFLDHSAGTTFRVWAELDALPELTFTRATEPRYNWVSNILPHEPYFLDESCRPRRERLELPLDEIRRRGFPSMFALQHAIAARCALRMTADYLDFLKTAGVYDNTRIVIVSDHGIVGDVEDHSSRAVAGGTTANAYVRTRSVLLVKERGAHGPLRVSEEFLPNAEVPRIVCEEIGGCVNPYLGNRPIATAGRDDPFYVSFVPWQFNLQEPDAFVIRGQLVLRGRDPYAASGWSVVK